LGFGVVGPLGGWWCLVGWFVGVLFFFFFLFLMVFAFLFFFLCLWFQVGPRYPTKNVSWAGGAYVCREVWGGVGEP